MRIGRVVGTVVSTICSPVFEGRRLLLCDLLDASGKPDGSYLICVDTVGSGAGETVLILDEGNSARQVVGMSPAPIRAVVVGIVDQLTMDGDLVSTTTDRGASAPRNLPRNTVRSDRARAV